MPSLGADMEAGTLVQWLVKPGDEVRRGDVIAVVETPKAAIEVEVFETGVVDRLLVEPGTKVPVGTPLAEIRAADVAPAPEGPAAMRPQPPEPVERVARPVEPPARPTAPETTPGRRRASPAARALAADVGVALEAVTGTGPDGAITRADVEQAALEPAEAPAEEAGAEAPEEAVIHATPTARRMAEKLGIDLRSIPGTGSGGRIVKADVERVVGPPALAEAGVAAQDQAAARNQAIRRSIAAAMAKSKREIPHYYLSAIVDVSSLLERLARLNLDRPAAERVLPAAAFIRAVALAALEVPGLNGYWIDDAFQPCEHVHVGVGISLRQGGLVAPALQDADRRSVPELMRDLRDLVARARAGRLRSSEVASATITVTNLGDMGVDTVHGIIYPPQVALVGFGRVADRPWAEKGLLGVRPLVTVSLAADHRASDGHTGGLFLRAIDRLLQQAEVS